MNTIAAVRGMKATESDIQLDHPVRARLARSIVGYYAERTHAKKSSVYA